MHRVTPSFNKSDSTYCYKYRDYEDAKCAKCGKSFEGFPLFWYNKHKDNNLDKGILFSFLITYKAHCRFEKLMVL